MSSKLYQEAEKSWEEFRRTTFKDSKVSSFFKLFSVRRTLEDELRKNLYMYAYMTGANREDK